MFTHLFYRKFAVSFNSKDLAASRQNVGFRCGTILSLINSVCFLICCKYSFFFSFAANTEHFQIFLVNEGNFFRSVQNPMEYGQAERR